MPDAKPLKAFTEYRQALEEAVRQGNATEHTFRPALKTLLETLAPDIIATNEPKRVSCGAPDFIITRGQVPLGYIETKDVSASLAEIEGSEQMTRYLAGLSNLILTDYLEFRWYVKGDHRGTARLATRGARGKLRPEPEGAQRLLDLLQAFLTEHVSSVNNAKELAGRMAVLARLLRDALRDTFSVEGANGPLHDYLTSFRDILLHDLTADQFADMYAQTVCYGLFTAACSPDVMTLPIFTRREADRLLPRTNPFLRRMFKELAESELEDYPFIWVVDTLADLLDHADMHAILRDFGKGTGREDPVVHFYETFLAAYDPKTREMRGVYYTPTPVVSYIVRSVDEILRRNFSLPDGLSDTGKVRVSTSDGEREISRVLILDPATGTGTFLHEVIARIHDTIMAKGQAGGWSSYVSQHLLPRLFGFELLMAPYAVAHMKLGMQLGELGYDFGSQERLRIFLTNTLEEPHDLAATLPMARWLADEARAASEIKRDLPILVILGNPPYSGNSANTGKWIVDLLRGIDRLTGKKTDNYYEVDGKPLGERNPKYLQDDYVKFIRFAQWRIERTGYGVLAFITNNGYLDNPTFRGMRQSILRTFDEIYLLDLHGNSKKREQAPDGGKDENVFDIMQGVSIGIFVKRPGESKEEAAIYHANLWGTREHKYNQLAVTSVEHTDWITLTPTAPLFLFIPKNEDARAEYEMCWKVTEIFQNYSTGVKTHRDNFTFAFTPEEIIGRIRQFRDLNVPDDVIRFQYHLLDTSNWNLSNSRHSLSIERDWEKYVTCCLYRPFDIRSYYHHDAVVDRPRNEIMQNFIAKENVGLITTRQTRDNWEALATKYPCDHKSCAAYDTNYVFPLYLYPNGKPKATLFELDEPSQAPGRRRPNLTSAFVAEMVKALGMLFVPEGVGDLQSTFGPEDIFHYQYAVFHAQSYRLRYAEFLKSDFPRLPLPKNVRMFRELCPLGHELTDLHLMTHVTPTSASYPITGTDLVEDVRYVPSSSLTGRVYINKSQYFEGIPTDVWEFYIGGYRVCERWLKDRKGRKLSWDDQQHYQNMVAALAATIRLMGDIDAVIARNGGWPFSLPTVPTGD